MKKNILILILTVIVLIGAGAQNALTQNAAELTFSFTRQSGSASNQFAVWIEDARGQYVKTLYATRWTANGGWQKRASSIPLWVKQFNLSEKPHEMLDVITGATPRTGTLVYAWDGTNHRGAAVPAGEYVLVLEATLRWENLVYYRAPIRLGQGAANANISVEYVSGDTASTAERTMINDVKVKVLR